MRTRIYIAGPISQGDLAANIRQATDAALALLKAGYAPFCPHLTCYLSGPHAERLPAGTQASDWYDVDLPWVAVSNAVLRLPGPSVGADLEVCEAVERGIPVYYSLPDLLKAVPADREEEWIIA